LPYQGHENIKQNGKVEKISSKMHTQKSAFLPPRVILLRREDFRLDFTYYLNNMMDISYFACQHIASPLLKLKFFKTRTNTSPDSNAVKNKNKPNSNNLFTKK
jgi:hypothetical protein